MKLTLSDFHYDLPTQSIAQSPAIPRDHARLMKIDRTSGQITHHYFYDLPHLISPNFHFIANNTKVFPARLIGSKASGGRVEILLLKKLPHQSYECICSPGLKVGNKINFSNNILTGVIIRAENRIRTIQFSLSDPTLTETLSSLGTMPTPPYIKQVLGNNSDYQTVYAKYGFSAAAPTAGLHFTSQLQTVIKKHFAWHELTLNVGLGTFLPVKENDISAHHMHIESYSLSPTLSRVLSSHPPVLAIGTTTMRALESNLDLQAGTHSTNIFIYPPYKFRIVDALITNFHLPQSTLLMLVSAFCSYPQTKEKFTTFSNSLLGHAYSEAILHKYRFFSFGDAMLII